jgi:hypothetical protein
VISGDRRKRAAKQIFFIMVVPSGIHKAFFTDTIKMEQFPNTILGTKVLCGTDSI